MQVSDNFGPLYQSVILDGAGYGAVSFQATGANIRLSNIFFRVSTSTSQAVCTIYKGQIADGNRVFNSNSGSTGANATGNVDLFDGETCYVVWTGGDVGSTATATFTGGKISFSEIAPASLISQEPVAAGDGALIFPALKSPNYVAGSTGWFLSRDGDIELNSAIVRGELIVTGENNEYIRIYTTNTDNAQIELGLPDNIGFTRTPALITTSPGITGVPSLIMRSPTVDGTPFSQISMVANTALDQSEVYIDATDIAVSAESEVSIFGGETVRIQNNIGAVGQFIVDASVDESVFENDVTIGGDLSKDNHLYMRGEQGTATMTLAAATTATLAVNFANTFPSTPVLSVNIDNGVGTFARWGARAINVSTTGFTMFVFKGDNADPAATGSFNVQWRATV